MRGSVSQVVERGKMWKKLNRSSFVLHTRSIHISVIRATLQILAPWGAISRPKRDLMRYGESNAS